MATENESCVSDRDDIIAMFSASGYHRSRVSCLNDFNRIVGGIAWAIARYDDVPVAADLLYEETEDQNIKVRTEQSEKIIEALEAVKCPHKLSAHQLLGLDFANLKNVVQWLLRRVVAQDAQEAKYEFFVKWFTMGHNSEEEAIAEYRRRLRMPNGNRSSTARHMKRFDNSVLFDLSLDAKCTLAEYVTYSRTGKRLYPAEEEEVQAEKDTNLQEASSKKHVPTNTVREMMDKAASDMFKNDPPAVVNVCDEICKLIDDYNIPERLCVLENRLVDEAESYHRALKDHEDLKNRYNSVLSIVSSSDQIDLQQMSEIMRTFQSVQARAQELRVLAVEDLDNHRKQENLLRQNVDSHGNIQKYDAHKREIMEEHAAKTEKFADSVRDVLALQFRLDRILGTTLSSHYRKRNVERVQDSARINQEMKSSVIDFNITIDILTFSSKITGFMNEVEKSLLAEPASQEYRDAFVAYMNDVRTQLGEYHWKAKLTQDNTISEKQTLAALRTTIRLKEREVTYTSGEMKKLLDMNKALQEVADTISAIEVDSPCFKREAGKKEAAKLKRNS